MNKPLKNKIHNYINNNNNNNDNSAFFKKMPFLPLKDTLKESKIQLKKPKSTDKGDAMLKLMWEIKENMKLKKMGFQRF